MDSSHPTLRMGAVAVLGGLEIVYLRLAVRASRSGRYDRSLDNCLVVLELARQDTEVDYPASRLVDQIDDLGDGACPRPLETRAIPVTSIATVLVRSAEDQRLSRPGSPGASARQVPRSGSYSSRSNSSMSSPSRISE
jgi:hypothetical protein